jgi:hypothetical protein
MILGSFRRQHGVFSYRSDGCLPSRAGEENRSQESLKGRFESSKNFATDSIVLAYLFGVAEKAP